MGDAAAHTASGDSADGRRWRCRCVMLVPAGSARPVRLLRGLRERGAEVAMVSDAPSALVELADGARVLIVHEPPRVRRCAELIDAVRQCHPFVRCWRSQCINGHGTVRLERYLSLDSAIPRPSPPAAPNPVAWVDAAPDQPSPAANPAPAMATQTPAPLKPSVDPQAAGRGEPWREGTPVLTAEELAMLLGGDDAGAYVDDLANEDGQTEARP